MIAPSILALAAAAAAPVALAVRTAEVEGRPAVEVLASATLQQAAVQREGGDLLILLEAQAPAGLAAPAPLAPMESVRIESGSRGLVVRVRVPAEVPYEVRRQGTVLAVVFGARPASERPEVAQLYSRIFPVAASGQSEEGAARPPDDLAPSAEGIHIGLFTLRPGVSATWIDAEGSFLDTPEPVREQYYEVRPQIGVEAPFSTGRLLGSYQARLRRSSGLALVGSTTHLVDGALELLVGPRLQVTATDHYSQGTLETTEVDPGREYFFGLGRFTTNDAAVRARLQTGGRLDLDASAGRRTVSVEDRATFFDHEVRHGSAGVGMDVGARLRASLLYHYEQVPAPAERPEAESEAHSGVLHLDGEVLPLVTGQVAVGYRDHHTPRAGSGGQRYRGLSVGGRLMKEFTRSATLALSGGHSTYLSAFEQNGLYVGSFGQAELTLPLPFTVSARAGAGYHVNAYRTNATEIGRPREDRIRAWSAGLGRSIGGFGFVRADYRRERRDSNIDRMDSRSYALSVEVGVRLYRGVEREVDRR